MTATDESASSTPLALVKPAVGDGRGEHTLLSASAGSSPRLIISQLSQPSSLSSLSTITLDRTKLPAHLKLPAKQIHVIISIHSGSRSAQAYYENLLTPLLRFLNIDFTLHTTKSSTAIADLTHQISSSGLENLIILLSGDTGISEYLNALNPENANKTLLCPLPLGTANAFSSAHNLTLKSLLHGSRTAFPTLKATFSPGSRENGEPIVESLNKSASLRGCVVASYGFHASIVGGSESEEYRKHGMDRFGMVARELIQGTFMGGPGKGPEMYNSKITGLKSVTGSRHSYLMMALVDRMEPTFVISPKSVNGEAWTLYTGDIGAEGLISVVKGAYAGGTHIESDFVGYERVDGFKVQDLDDRETWKRWICVDGRCIEVPQGGWAEIKLESKEDGFYVLL